MNRNIYNGKYSDSVHLPIVRPQRRVLLPNPEAPTTTIAKLDAPNISKPMSRQSRPRNNSFSDLPGPSNVKNGTTDRNSAKSSQPANFLNYFNLDYGRPRQPTSTSSADRNFPSSSTRILTTPVLNKRIKFTDEKEDPVICASTVTQAEAHLVLPKKDSLSSSSSSDSDESSNRITIMKNKPELSNQRLSNPNIEKPPQNSNNLAALMENTVSSSSVDDILADSYHNTVTPTVSNLVPQRRLKLKLHKLDQIIKTTPVSENLPSTSKSYLASLGSATEGQILYRCQLCQMNSLYKGSVKKHLQVIHQCDPNTSGDFIEVEVCKNVMEAQLIDTKSAECQVDIKCDGCETKQRRIKQLKQILTGLDTIKDLLPM